MFSKKFWDKNKVKEFPDIEDWTDAQNHLRFNNDIKSMDWKTWYWFHPSAFLLMQYGSIILTFFIFLGSFIFVLTKNLIFLGFINGFILFILGHELFKKIKLYKVYKEMNHYDLYLREDVTNGKKRV